jgi:nucleoid-associated protein YgaU
MPRVAFDVSRLRSQRDPTDGGDRVFMSDDDRKRPPTQGWTFSPTGGMTRNSGEVVVIEGAPSVPSPVDRREEPTAPKHMPPPIPPGRKSAIEEFNEELAALERPLEGEVEYFDEAPPPSRWRQAAALFTVVVVVGVGGALLISRNRASAGARELAAAEAPVAAAAVAVAPPSPALAAEQAPPALAAPEAPAAADAPAADEAAADSAGADSAQPAPSTRSAWTKVRAKAGHPKHTRSGSSKTAHRSTKTKRTVIAKNTASRRH